MGRLRHAVINYFAQTIDRRSKVRFNVSVELRLRWWHIRRPRATLSKLEHEMLRYH